MTVEELREELGKDAKRVDDRFAEVREGITSLANKFEQLLVASTATTAKLDVMAGQNDAQIALLFSQQAKQQDRITHIETDYVKREELKAEFVDRDKKLDAVRLQVAYWCGGIALILGLIELGFKLWK